MDRKLNNSPLTDVEFVDVRQLAPKTTKSAPVVLSNAFRLFFFF